MAIDKGLSQEAELRLRITSDNPQQIIRAIEDLIQAQERAGKSTEHLDRLLNNLTKGTKSTTSAQTAAASATKAAGEEHKRAARAVDDHTASLPRLRYALYDVASSATRTSLAITAVGTAAVVSAAKYESAFTNVERTLEPGSVAVGRLRQELVALSSQIPVTFTELSRIATLGNQLGIAGGDVASFTETVARFSAVTGVSAEETAKAFGAMQYSLDVPASEFENLGAAIALVGRKSVATEPEILSLAREIGTQANAAGFAADEVIALAGTLGQLRLPPERSRGALTTYFGTLNRAIAEGGDQMRNFAIVTGMSMEELDKAVRGGRGVEVFQRFIQGLGKADDVVEVSVALDQLGLSQLRVEDVFKRLGKNADVFNGFLAVSAQGYSEGTELARQYALTVDDLASKWQIFLNNLMTLGSTIGSTIGPALVIALDLANNLLEGLTKFAKSNAGKVFTGIAAAVGVLSVALLGIIGVTALAGASTAALRTAMAEVAGIARSGALGPWIAGLFGVKGATDGATASSRRFAGAMGTAVKSLGWVAIIGMAISLFTDFGGTIEGFGGMFLDQTNMWAKAFLGFMAYLANGMRWMPGIGEIAGRFADSAEWMMSTVDKMTSDLKKRFSSWTQTLPRVTEETEKAKYAQDFWNTSLDEGGDLLDLINPKLDLTTQRVRTLADVASDAGSVMKRAFDIRFGPQIGLDAIASGWNKIKEEAEGARQAILDHQHTLAGLKADKATLEYWLSVAVMYKDEERAAQIRAQLGEVNGKIADENKAIKTEQDKANKSLNGNSDAAIANRAALLGLVGDYQSYIQALIASGASQDEINRAIADSKQKFIDQATQLGFSRAEVNTYAQSFDDMSKIVREIPRDVTVDFNADPALQAMAEFVAKAEQAGSDAGQSWVDALRQAIADRTDSAAESAAFMGTRIGAELMGGINAAIADSPTVIVDGKPVFDFYTSGKRKGVGSSRNRAGGGFFASGGYTGNGAKFSPAGIVHRGEYVMPKTVVRNLGVQEMARIHRLGMRGRGYANGGYVGGATPRVGSQGPITGVVGLDAMTIQAIASAVRPMLFLDGRQVANNSSAHFANSTALGSA